MCGKRGYFAQFCCEPKTVLKKTHQVTHIKLYKQKLRHTALENTLSLLQMGCVVTTIPAKEEREG